MNGELPKDEGSNIPQYIFINEIYNITLDKTIIAIINKRYNHTEDILKSLAYFSPNRFNDEHPSDLFLILFFKITFNNFIQNIAHHLLAWIFQIYLLNKINKTLKKKMILIMKKLNLKKI